MAQQTDHIGDTNKMVEHHIVDTSKIKNMTPEEKFKKDMKFLQENLRRTYNPTWYEKILDVLFFFPFIAFILTLIAIITLIF